MILHFRRKLSSQIFHFVLLKSCTRTVRTCLQVVFRQMADQATPYCCSKTAQRLFLSSLENLGILTGNTKPFVTAFLGIL